MSEPRWNRSLELNWIAENILPPFFRELSDTRVKRNLLHERERERERAIECSVIRELNGKSVEQRDFRAEVNFRDYPDGSRQYLVKAFDSLLDRIKERCVELFITFISRINAAATLKFFYITFDTLFWTGIVFFFRISYSVISMNAVRAIKDGIFANRPVADKFTYGCLSGRDLYYQLFSVTPIEFHRC